MEESSGNILIYVILGTSGMLLLIVAMGFFVVNNQKRMFREKQNQAKREIEYQTKMIQMQLESQEQERKRIGADLHDSLGSLLRGAKVNASLIQRSTELQGESLESHLELLKILDESIQTVRRIAWELTPEAFHYSGLSESVRKLCNQFDGKVMHIALLDSQGELWNDNRALHVFRIIQELMMNAFKHSRATQLNLTLDWQISMLEVRITDNGSGSEGNERKGVGLWNVEQRIKQLKAEIFIGNPPIGTGTEILMRIPLTDEK